MTYTFLYGTARHLTMPRCILHILLSFRAYPKRLFLPKKTHSEGGFSSLAELHSVGIVTSTETYAYPSTDSSFRDKLTSYNNHTITYDGVGNPTSYYNGSPYTMTWQEGRELASVTKGGVTTSYVYNSDGIRTEKTSGGVHTVYRLAGDKIVELKRTANGNTGRYSFTYDENGRPYSVTVPGLNPGTTVTYYYVYNIQGDVIKFIDNYGNAAVNYTYDAWGNVVSIKDQNGNAITSMTDIGRVNPFRYRGYIYDEETGFYYCKSRYYDPKIRRFINVDCLIDSGAGINGFNLYAYCINNPVMFDDPSGNIVTDWDRAHCTDDEIDTLYHLTNMWNLFPLNRAQYHSDAVSIREKYLSEGQYVDAMGYVRKNEFYVMTYTYGDYLIDILLTVDLVSVDVKDHSYLSTYWRGLSEYILNTYYKLYKKNFPGRTVEGVQLELETHNLFSKFGSLFPWASPADIESSECTRDHLNWYLFE